MLGTLCSRHIYIYISCQNSKAGKGKKLFGKLSSMKEDSDSDKGTNTHSLKDVHVCSDYALIREVACKWLQQLCSILTTCSSYFNLYNLIVPDCHSITCTILISSKNYALIPVRIESWGISKSCSVPSTERPGDKPQENPPETHQTLTGGPKIATTISYYVCDRLI